MPVHQHGPLLTIPVEKDLLSGNCELMAAELALLIMVSHCGRMLTSPFADAYVIARQRICRILGIVEKWWERNKVDSLFQLCYDSSRSDQSGDLFTWHGMAVVESSSLIPQ